MTLHESELDSLIFGSTNFPGDTIDIRFNSIETLVDTTGSFLDIDVVGEFNLLKANFSSLASNIIRMFFVDSIKVCNGNGNFAGCADSIGNDIILNSGNASNSSWGHILLAHEIGHNLLGSGHDGSSDNVMNGTVSNANHNQFTNAQIETIGNSQLIQFDGPGDSGQRFINITPILVSAAAVPIPGAIVLFASAIASFGLLRGRRRRIA